MNDLIDSTNEAHGKLRQAIETLVAAQYNVMATVNQGNAAFAAALDAMTKAIAAPRRLIEDAAGNPVGVEPVTNETEQNHAT